MSEITEANTSKFADLDGLKIHYHDAGKGPAVVLLHGGGPGASSWSNFKGNIAELSKKYRVIMMDQPGFGKSGRPIYENEKLGAFAARALRNLLKHLGIEKAHLIGNSMGGHVSLKFAIDYPEATGKLVLMAPAIQVTFLTPAPSEGSKHLFGYYRGNGPTPDKMRAFLNTLVYNQAMVTDELVKQRYEISAEPSTVEWTQKMFSSPGSVRRTVARARQGAAEDASSVGTRRSRHSSRASPVHGSAVAERGASRGQQMRSLGDDRASRALQSPLSRVPRSGMMP